MRNKDGRIWAVMDLCVRGRRKWIVWITGVSDGSCNMSKVLFSLQCVASDEMERQQSNGVVCGYVSLFGGRYL